MISNCLDESQVPWLIPLYLERSSGQNMFFIVFLWCFIVFQCFLIVLHSFCMVCYSVSYVFHCFFMVFQRTGFQRTGNPSIFIDGHPSMNINGFPSMNINGFPSMNSLMETINESIDGPSMNMSPFFGPLSLAPLGRLWAPWCPGGDQLGASLGSVRE